MPDLNMNDQIQAYRLYEQRQAVIDQMNQVFNNVVPNYKPYVHQSDIASQYLNGAQEVDIFKPDEVYKNQNIPQSSQVNKPNGKVDDSRWEFAINMVQSFIVNECGENKFFECLEALSSDELKEQATHTHIR